MPELTTVLDAVTVFPDRGACDAAGTGDAGAG
jgi:hypothetical protein